MKFNKYILIFGALTALMFPIQSCQDLNNDPPFDYPEEPEEPEPPIPTLTDPSSIAKDNLVAYFPFDGDGMEQISTLGPTTEPNVEYTVGQRGLAWKGTDRAYLLYDVPDDSKLRTMKAYTLSMWIEQPQIPNATPPVPMIFQLTNTDDSFWGNISLSMDRSDDNALQFKSFFRKEGAEWAGQHVSYKDEAFVPSKWIHLIINYDNQSSTYSMYVDGNKLEMPEGTANRYASDPEAGGSPLGDLNFTKADQINFGAWIPKAIEGATDEWMGWFEGKLDEFRIYDKALSNEEAKELYEAELQNVGKVTITDPSSIAKDNLVAYFPFNNNVAEKISFLNPSTEPNIEYTVGQRGLAWKGTDGAYLLYDVPGDSKLRTMKAYTLSMWIEQPQIPNATPPVPMIFQLTNTDDSFWGNISLSMDRSDDNALQFKSFFKKDGVEWAGQHVSHKDEAFTPSEWMYLTINYDNQTSTYNMYVNGNKLELPEGTANRYASDPAAGGSPLGDLNFTKADQINFGAWIPKAIEGATDEWMGWFEGKLDEFRIYDKALNNDEVKALYDAEISFLKK